MALGVISDLIGQRINQYRIEKLLGEGGMGAVYRAFHMNLKIPVAFKVMHREYARQPNFRRRFEQEAQTSAGLDHPSIITVHDFGQAEGIYYLVMAFVDGANLSAHIAHMQKQQQLVNLKETLSVMAQVGDALGYAHRKGVIHRDVKPDNVMLKQLDEPDSNGDLPLRAIVTDFGLAKLSEGNLQTQTGTFMGTLPYMSPEQCAGQELNGRSDIYSLGIMLFQLTTGQLPFEIKSPTDAALKHLKEPLPMPRTFNPALPENVESIILQATAKNPEDRFQKAEEISEALRQARLELSEDETFQIAAPDAVYSLLTRLENSGDILFPSQQGYEIVAPAKTDQLIITRKGEIPKPITLTRPIMTIGRLPASDVLLPGTGVSKQHARLERKTSGWWVTDLGSTNGTYLNDMKLLPEIPEKWFPGQSLQIGRYFLRWQPAVKRILRGVPASPPDKNGFTAVPSVPRGATQILTTSGQINVIINPTNLKLNPGDEAEVQLQLLNQGSIVDHFRIILDGLPSEWFSISQETVQLMPGDIEKVVIKFHLPADSSAIAGQHPYRLLIHAETERNETAAVTAHLSIPAFEEYESELLPNRLENGQSSQLTILNKGNSEMTYMVNVRDPAETFKLVREILPITVPPGEGQSIDITLATRQRPLLGNTESYPFTIQVKSETGKQQIHPGQLAAKPHLPILAVSALGVALFFVCFASMITGIIVMRSNQLSEAQAVISELNQATNQQGIISPENGAGNRDIAANQTPNDNDNDGLSDNVEGELNTDPNNPDTDGDGLTDSQEVNEFQTLPRKMDSDGDTLTDRDEIERGSNPLNPDSDGDGLPDGLDVDPLHPATAVTPETGLPPTPTLRPTSTSPTTTNSPAGPITNSEIPCNNNQIAFTENNGVFLLNLADQSLPLDISENFIPRAGKPSWSPDGKQLAFESDGTLYITTQIRSDRWSIPEALDLGGISVTSPVWSATGNHIAFVANNSIYLTDIENPQPVQITDAGNEQDIHPVWSPDGSRIAFQTSRGPDNWAIGFVVAAENGTLTLFEGQPGNESTPAWHPSGTQIAFAAAGGEYDEPGIYLMDLNGNIRRRLTSVAAIPGFNPETDSFAFPAWNQTGSQIVFEIFHGQTNDRELFVMNSDGGGLRSLGTFANGPLRAVWRTCN